MDKIREAFEERYPLDDDTQFIDGQYKTLGSHKRWYWSPKDQEYWIFKHGFEIGHQSRDKEIEKWKIKCMKLNAKLSSLIKLLLEGV